MPLPSYVYVMTRTTYAYTGPRPIDRITVDTDTEEVCVSREAAQIRAKKLCEAWAKRHNANHHNALIVECDPSNNAAFVIYKHSDRCLVMFSYKETKVCES